MYVETTMKVLLSIHAMCEVTLLAKHSLMPYKIELCKFFFFYWNVEFLSSIASHFLRVCACKSHVHKFEYVYDNMYDNNCVV